MFVYILFQIGSIDMSQLIQLFTKFFNISVIDDVNLNQGLPYVIIRSNYMHAQL